MKEENHHYRLSEDKRYILRAIDRLAIGSIILAWGSLLLLQQAGIVEKNVRIWPCAFIVVGILIVVGGIYRLCVREKPASAEQCVKIWQDRM
jgi:hypothetical protein